MKNYVHNPKTVAHYTMNIKYWEDAKREWDKRLRNNPEKKMTITGHKSIHYIANQEIAKLRRDRAELISRKQANR